MTRKLSLFQDAAVHILANKLFMDYVTARNYMPIEPEHYVELWIKQNTKRLTKLMEKFLWRYYLQNLFIQKETNIK